MGTKVTGGGGGGASVALSESHCSSANGFTIASGALSILPITNFSKSPSSTTDYTYVADAGNGGPGIRINNHGMYLVNAIIQLATDTAGLVDFGLDYPPYNGVQPFGGGTSYIATVNQQILLSFSAIYFTVAGQAPDAMSLYLRNNTAGILTLGNDSVGLELVRLGDSPG